MVEHVDLTDVRKYGYRHPPFFGAMLQDILRIKAILEPVYPLTLAQWQDKFRRTRYAGREIRQWLDFAEAYRDHIDGMSFDERMHAFEELHLTTFGTRPAEPASIEPLSGSPIDTKDY